MNFEGIVNYLQANYAEIYEAIKTQNPGMFGKQDGFNKVRIDHALIQAKKKALLNMHGKKSRHTTNIINGK